jgi:hypothetical protein
LHVLGYNLIGAFQKIVSEAPDIVIPQVFQVLAVLLPRHLAFGGQSLENLPGLPSPYQRAESINDLGDVGPVGITIARILALDVVLTDVMTSVQEKRPYASGELPVIKRTRRQLPAFGPFFVSLLG